MDCATVAFTCGCCVGIGWGAVFMANFCTLPVSGPLLPTTPLEMPATGLGEVAFRLLPDGEPEPMLTLTARGPPPVLDPGMPGIPATPMLTRWTAGPDIGLSGLSGEPKRTALGWASLLGTWAAEPIMLTARGAGGAG